MDFDVKALLAPPNPFTFKKILCVQPHPDDNEIGMGGTIAVLAAQGCEIHYLNVTNGDLGNKDKSATREQTAAQRRKETQLAGNHLGVAHYHYFDHGDSSLGDVRGLSMEIAEIIREVAPDAVFGPDPHLPYEAHLDHVVTGQALANAFRISQAQAIGYYFTASPNTVIDVSEVFDKKFEAIALHDSQMTPETLGMFRVYFSMKGQELAAGKGFAMGEGLKMLSQLHVHCFVDADRI